MIVLDTNVLSELLKAAPAPEVTQWMSAQAGSSLFTTATTQAELLYGVAILPHGKRRVALQNAVDAMLDKDFAERVLSFDDVAARAYGEIAATRRAQGRIMDKFDAQIAAIARCHGATLATRDTSHFADCGLVIVDPWTV